MMKTGVCGVAALLAAAALIASPTAMAAPSWTMPNLIGMDLQGAQDAIQSLTDGEVWFSSSTDLTGQGRAQISDRNWQVCSSTPAPGAKFSASTQIDFGVVRIDTEDCP
ncbi:PASTA domain-containing protein [Mycolicibacterium sp. HK-90]|uniref:PASTA domain-containing protein n=1 Tax=Mycolicibacterium sp. HK-90 TaxID=3056937 RepID=UPI00265925B5|nr:PASTA domain-containing protein [Mycolicibacterium sp. HK-90]WKG04617.1 PASTA domain-containing protein [Mycolicibacterium sp. HK-90]